MFCQYLCLKLSERVFFAFSAKSNFSHKPAPRLTHTWPRPTGPFHNARASKQVEWRILCRTETRMDGFWDSEIVKGSVGHIAWMGKTHTPKGIRLKISWFSNRQLNWMQSLSVDQRVSRLCKCERFGWVYRKRQIETRIILCQNAAYRHIQWLFSRKLLLRTKVFMVLKCMYACMCVRMSIPKHDGYPPGFWPDRPFQD